MAPTLKRLNTSARVALSFFLLSIIIGTVSALIMLGLLLTHQESGFAIPSVESIKIKYHYPQLVSAMKTSMNQYVADDADIETVAKWIAGGKSEATYEAEVRPILRRDCTSCHSPGSTMTDAMPGMPLTTYQEVLPLTQAGYSWVKMAKQAHVHLFGIGTFLALVTLIFAFTSFRPWLRITAISVTWTALLLDVLCWWLTKYELGFAYVIVGAGAAMSGGAIAMSALALLDLWVRVPLISDPKAGDGGPG
ncbi:MAG: hypothetical protein L6R48_18430 [Planctomycetes bacterium]|nr:hypothetical protein [Planctomycetota bacterium]